MSKTKYPRIVDAGSDNIFAKAFITANGNEELCNATGREFAENTYPIMKQNKN